GSNPHERPLPVGPPAPRGHFGTSESQRHPRAPPKSRSPAIIPFAPFSFFPRAFTKSCMKSSTPRKYHVAIGGSSNIWGGMTNGQTSEVLQHLRTSVLREAGGLSDRQLLEIFIERRDEAAFEAIVRRHGPMVMGVCGRVLRNRQDAEDAFQAVFLVLVRKAAAITSRELLAAWLYGVAYNTALKAKSAAARRRRKERQATAMLEPDSETSSPERDWLPFLDRELNGLPDRYRLPIVLCELQGKSHKEAARELGCPIGTLSGRLSRGRNLLAKRLARHRRGRTARALAAVFAQQAGYADVSEVVDTGA